MAKRQNHRKLRAFLLSWRNVELVTVLWLFLLFPFLAGAIYGCLPFVPRDFRIALAATFGLLLSTAGVARSMEWAKSGKEGKGPTQSSTCPECGSIVPLSSGCVPILVIPAAGAVVTMGLRFAFQKVWNIELGEGFLIFGWLCVSYLGFLILRPFDDKNANSCPKCKTRIQGD